MSATYINFDSAGNIEIPTMVLSYRNAKIIGVIGNIEGLNVSDSLGNPTEFTFDVHKTLCKVWKQLIDYRLIWVPEWDKWFTISVQLSEDSTTLKTVTATHLPEADLGQLNLYNIEINTENDMFRKDYNKDLPTIFYRSDTPEASILHRVIQKAVNFKIIHVDESLAQLTNIFEFVFDNITIYDALLQIAEEIKCIFIFGAYKDETGRLIRTISVYDLQDYCQDCGCREDFMDKCPKCNSENIIHGYGIDTGIFWSVDNTLDNVTYSTNLDSLKNCFKLEAGDDYMTDTIRGCNPTGSDYIWHISEDMKKNDMSLELCAALDIYQEKYDTYLTSYESILNVDEYNKLIQKYTAINEVTQKPFYSELELSTIDTNPIIGHANLMNVLYDTIDMTAYLEYSLMPFVENKLEETSAQIQLKKLYEELGTVAVSTTSGLDTITTVKSSIESIAKVIVDSRYKASVTNILHISSDISEDDDKTLIGTTWHVWFSIINNSNEEDLAITEETSPVTVYVNTDNELFMEQKIEKQLLKGDGVDYSIVGLFNLELEKFKIELTKYGLSSLKSFLDAAQGVITVLIEQGANNPSNFPITDPEGVVYNNLYLPYKDEKIPAIEAEISLRESEIKIVTDLQTEVNNIRTQIANDLDLENNLGEVLWSELNSFRREDIYSNSNYISDGKTNSELYRSANEFLESANKEIQKASTLQHVISTTVKNIFAIDKFAPLRKSIVVGNWLRIGIEDNVYKLRLLTLDLNYDDYLNIPVEFSDVEKISDDISDVQGIINNMNSIATSYDYVEHQASRAVKEAENISSIFSQGLDLTKTNIINNAKEQTITFDKYGLWCKEYDDITETYLPEQLRIINSTLVITDDNWETIKTALGKFHYIDPITREVKTGYGVNGEVLVGKVIIGENLALVNDNNHLTFDQNGLCVYNDFNKVIINPNDSASIFTIQKISGNNAENILTFNEGNLEITGTIHATDGEFEGHIVSGSGMIGGWYLSDTRICSSDTISCGNKEAGVLLINEVDKPYIWAQNDKGDKIFSIERNGSLFASGGTIAGWGIDSNALYRSSKTWKNSKGMYFGVNGISIKNKFFVNSDGKLEANDANITGTIKADSFSADTSYKLYVGEVENTIIQANTWNSNEVASFTLGTGNCKIKLTSDKNGYGMIHIYAPYGVIAENDAFFQASDFKLNDGSGTSLKYHAHTHVQNENGYRVYLTNNDNVNFIPAQNFGVGEAGDRCQGVISLGSDYNYFKNINYSGELDKISDRRVKNDFGDLSIEESKLIINGLKLKKFTYKTDDMSKLHYGIYAQDLRDLLINSNIECNAALSIFDTTQDRKTFDLYLNEDNASYSVDYTQFIPLNIKVTQQHEKDINSLMMSDTIKDERISELENKIAHLEQQLATLTA